MLPVQKFPPDWLKHMQNNAGQEKQRTPVKKCDQEFLLISDNYPESSSQNNYFVLRTYLKLKTNDQTLKLFLSYELGFTR